MKSSVKELTVDTDNIKRKEKFNLRWNIVNEESRDKTRLRCLAIISSTLDDCKRIIESRWGNMAVSLNELCSDISMILGIPIKSNIYSSFEDKYLYDYISRLDLKKDENYKTFIYFLEIILNYDFEIVDRDKLALKLAEALKLSNAKLKIIKDNDEYLIFPTNVEILDQPLVFDNLYWLNNYADVKNHFLKALKFERKEEYYRNIIDELRLSLELLLKSLFNNNKSLENQKNNLGNYFNNNNVSNSISNMYIKLFDLYTIYNNDNAKHGDDINYVEIDYLIYITGTFIRFIMQIEENKIEVK